MTWTLPEWASELLYETLMLDAESPAFDKKLREELRLALETIRID